MLADLWWRDPRLATVDWLTTASRVGSGCVMGSSMGVFKRCECRDPATGRLLGVRCPLLARRTHGSWSFRLELPRLRDGKRRQLRRGGFASRKAAVAAREFLRNPTDVGRAVEVVTVGQWLRVWLDSREGLSPGTMRNYHLHMRRYLVPFLGQVRLRELTEARVQAMFTSIIRTDAEWGTPHAPATLHRVHATLRAALNAAHRRGLITANPARYVELPAERRPHAVVWTPTRIAQWRTTGLRPRVAVWTLHQTATFLTAIRQHRLYPLFHLVAVLGLRRGEVLGLRWSDLDMDAGLLAVCRQVRRVGGHTEIATPKSEASDRMLALDHDTITILRRLRSASRSGGGEPVGYLFPDRRGQPLAPDRVTHLFRALNTASGLPPIRLHDLRHGAASLSLAAGNDLETVQAMLGHASIVLTADTYTSVLPSLAHQAAEATARAVLQVANTTGRRLQRDRRRPTATSGARKRRNPSASASHRPRRPSSRLNPDEHARSTDKITARTT